MKKIKIYKNKTVFGWKNDKNLGEKLIKQIISRKKWATCAAREFYTKKELKQTYKNKGKIITVFDKNHKPRCNIRIIDVFETTFGKPNKRLLKGEGNKTIREFQNDYKKVWKGYINLESSTVLVVEVFKLID
mgnify:CR=1 FL=1